MTVRRVARADDQASDGAGDQERDGASARTRGRAGRASAVLAAAALGLIVVVVGGGLARCSGGPFASVPGLGASSARRTFPDVDAAATSPAQQAFLRVAKAEYAAQRPGTAYAQGVEEPWCADFVSWVARESGAPLTNPNSGGWRLPGVFTLREALQKAGTWRSAGSGYVPKPGDIAIYDDPSPFGQHTNFVLAARDGVLTTIGGNGPGGIVVSEHRLGPELGVLGFGAR